MPKKEKSISEEENVMPGTTLQDFMNDMKDLGKATQNKDLVKPASFNYGDGSVTNYLLWLVLAELMKLNDKLEEE